MRKFIRAILSLALSLTMGIGALPAVTASASSALTNLFDPAKSTAGWINSEGASSPDGGFHISEAIEVTDGDVMYFGAAVTGQGWHLVTLDNHKNVTGDGTLAKGVSQVVTIDSNTAIMKYTVPKGTAYVRFICETRYLNAYVITKNEALTEKIYMEITNMEKQNDGLSEFNVNPESPLIGKSALFCGDSISYGQWDITSGYGGWGTRIRDAYKMTVSNPSMGGYSISTIREGRIINQVNGAQKGSYDYVVLQGGVNDAWGDGKVYAAPGTISDSYDVADFDITTYAGALEELFYYSLQYFPDAKIGYIITFATPGAKGIGHTDDMGEYYSEAIKICGKWNIQYLDLYHDPYVSNTLLQVSSLTYLRDPIHPNEEGYNRLSPYIAKWMEGLVDNALLKKNRLYNKTALFCGDSISYGSSDSTPGRAWAGRIGENCNMIVDNQSCSGWTLSTARGSQIVQQLQKKRNTLYDYVILHGGVNDAWESAPVGQITESFDVADFDVSTYAGALEHLFYYARKYYPVAKTGYIMNFATPTITDGGNLTNMDMYYSVGAEICKKWNVQYLDLYHDDYVNNTLLQVNGRDYMADAVHPNSAGYNRLAPYIAEWMKMLEQASDVKAANKVITKIDALPKAVTVNDKTVVDEALAAYDALTFIQKPLVSNFNTLEEAGLITDPPTYGDIDGKKGVSAADALLVLQAAVKKITLSRRQTVAADVDGKTGITAADALLVLQKAVSKIDKFPVEINK